MEKIISFALISIFSFVFCSVTIAQTQKQGNQNYSNETEIQKQNQIQIQQQNQIQEQEQIQNQNKIQFKQQNKIQENTETNTTGTQNANTQRSGIANFVQKLLDIADLEKGEMGEQIKTMTQEQNKIKNNIDEKVKKIQERNKIQTFLFGNDYKNLGQLRSETVKVENQIRQLQNATEKIKNQNNKQILQEQIQALEQEQIQINKFIQENENKFSLFGWLTKLFNK
ncbi:MAG TPA: hypothetical protein PKL13_00790 [bacterium]|nr:hypothetical protein [bacterium]